MKKKMLMSFALAALITTVSAPSVMATSPENALMPEKIAITMTSFDAESAFSNLVENGIISQETADNMCLFENDFFEQLKERQEQNTENTIHKTNIVDLYAEMVTAEIITQEQCDQIKAYQKEQAQLRYETTLNQSMNRYVSEGIIDQNAADQATEYLLENDFSEFSLPSALKIKDKTLILNEEANVDISPNEGNKHIRFHSAPDGTEEIDAPEGGMKMDQIHIHMNFGIDFEKLVAAGIITNEQSEQMIASDQASWSEQISLPGQFTRGDKRANDSCFKQAE